MAFRAAVTVADRTFGSRVAIARQKLSNGQRSSAKLARKASAKLKDLMARKVPWRD